MKLSIFTFRQNARAKVNETKQAVGYGSKIGCVHASCRRAFIQANTHLKGLVVP